VIERGCFVTGTDTGVGKSVLAAVIAADLAAAGEPVRAYKPIVTGADDPPGEWPPDDELLGLAAGRPATEVVARRLGPAVSPHLALALDGSAIAPAQLGDDARRLGAAGPLVVEGVGGLLVPLTDDYSVLDFAVDLALPLVVAARPGLGTINHTLLTLAAAREAGLDVRAVVLTPWPRRPDAMLRSNRETIARLGAVDVHTLEPIAAARPELLAAAAADLPVADWLRPVRAAV
jgi:dethiobiotin synthetase